MADGLSNPDRARRPELALVTGAASGIGRATAVALARRGDHVVAVDLDASGAERTARLCSLAGAAHTRAVEVDVGDGDAMESLAKTLDAEVGIPDVVVLCAGIALAGPILDTTVEDWEQILAVNLWGVIHGARLFGRRLVERGRGGHLAIVASAAALGPSSCWGAYATTKSATLMLAECLRAELARHGVGVSAICPGFTATPITLSTRYVGMSAAEQADRREWADRIYSRRGLTPARVAASVLEAIDSNRAVVPVGAEARLSQLAARLTPGAVRRLACIDVLSLMSLSLTRR